MKFTVSKEVPSSMLSYPVLMRSIRGRDCIILFTARNTGMELTEDGFEPSEDNWVAADDRSEWVPFTGTITIAP